MYECVYIMYVCMVCVCVDMYGSIYVCTRGMCVLMYVMYLCKCIRV